MYVASKTAIHSLIVTAEAPQKAEGGAIIYGGSHAQNIGSFQLYTAEQCSQHPFFLETLNRMHGLF